MSNLNSKDIREIGDSVQEAVLDSVKWNLSQIKPQIVSEIKNELEKTYSANISTLESRIAKLEQQILNSGMERSENNIRKGAAMHRIDVSRIYGGFRYNGWIYYPNEDMGNFFCTRFGKMVPTILN